MTASVIIPVYNEEQNIAALLRAVVAVDDVDDVLVVASGCTDGTVDAAEAVQHDFPQVRILLQPQREGKASAINFALPVARQDVIVLVSGDVLPADGAVDALIRCLEDPSVGVAGGRPVPRNDASTFIGFATHLLWRLHHRINEGTPDNPKCGEMIAFRRRQGDRWLVPAIPMDSAVDEVSIQSLIHYAGLRSRYRPEAIVHTWGPSTLRDWFIQRRRINAGHIVSRKLGYKPSTMSVRAILKACASDPFARRRPHWVVATMAIEATARVAGRIDMMRGKRHTVWKIADSTKRSMATDAAGHVNGHVDIPAHLASTNGGSAHATVNGDGVEQHEGEAVDA